MKIDGLSERYMPFSVSCKNMFITFSVAVKKKKFLAFCSKMTIIITRVALHLLRSRVLVSRPDGMALGVFFFFWEIEVIPHSDSLRQKTGAQARH